ncbi:MAG: COX15/CtaA family protein [Rhodospirillales bacterium]
MNTATDTRETDLPRPGAFDPVATWLLVICAMVFAMIILGGVTRLTQSGLSMVDWHPVTGWLPPLTEAAWQAAFDAYRQSPEYRHINAGMSLGGFQEIFWLEYLHRLFGRVIGIVFLVPFAWFLAKGRLNGPIRGKCVILFVLGGLQGVLGRNMVKSGLVDEPSVSQYRLAAHLSLALVIYLYALWTALDIIQPRYAVVPRGRRFVAWATGLLGFIFLTVFSGARVAGLDAGLLYNTFTVMEGRLLPADAFQLRPVYLNFFEDRATVQFDHRVLAVATVCVVLVFWAAVRRSDAPRDLKQGAGFMALVVLAQAGIGIATLLTAVPVALGALHQAGAVMLLTSALWCLHQARR